MLEGKQGPLELTCENMFVDAILGNRDLMDLLDLWVTSRLTNMHVERLFARLRKASPSKHANLERMCSAAYCSEVLQEHYQAGSLHPSVVTRQELVDEGAPIQAAQLRSTPMPTKARGHLIHMHKKLAKARQAAGGSLSKDEQVAV